MAKTREFSILKNVKEEITYERDVKVALCNAICELIKFFKQVRLPHLSNLVLRGEVSWRGWFTRCWLWVCEL